MTEIYRSPITQYAPSVCKLSALRFDSLTLSAKPSRDCEQDCDEDDEFPVGSAPEHCTRECDYPDPFDVAPSDETEQDDGDETVDKYIRDHMFDEPPNVARSGHVVAAGNPSAKTRACCTLDYRCEFKLGPLETKEITIKFDRARDAVPDVQYMIENSEKTSCIAHRIVLVDANRFVLYLQNLARHQCVGAIVYETRDL